MSAFFTLDGIDGTGKSTQVALLAEALRERGHRVTTCADPGGTALGTKLRAILLHDRHQIGMRAEALLFLASRAELVELIIAPALARGEVVLSDRFSLANIVYQGHAGRLPPDELWKLAEFSSAGLQPRLTFVLDLPLDTAKARRGAKPDRVESRTDDYFQRVRAGFLLEAERRPESHVVIDASPSVQAVHENILQIVLQHLGT